MAVEQLQIQARALAPEIIRWRRALHAMPELKMDTPNTEAYIAGVLEQMGVEQIQTGVGGHGVTALIRGALPGKTLAIRADCDGLPIREETGLPFASQNGCMHACGHDAHTAMALGAAWLLQQRRQQLRGNVKLIFQPYEEGDGGARAMLAQDVLAGVDAIIALHNHCAPEPGLTAGDVLVHPQATSANIYAYEAVFTGQPGHVCLSRSLPSAVHMACRAADRICSLPAPGPETVNAVTVVQGGVRNNIVAQSCTLAGSIRAFDTALHSRMRSQVARILEDTARELGGSVALRATIDLMATRIDPQLYQRFQQVVAALRPDRPCRILTSREMVGEDFARFAQQVPGMFFMLHTRKAGSCYPLHHPKFDVEEAVLPEGSALFAAFALQWQGE